MYNILIVDDEPNIRDIVKKYAAFEGHAVVEARDGLEAVGLCEKTKFDVIILDVMMPELDGFSTCRELRKFCDTPIIMLSARGEEYDRIHGFELGVDDYVSKPFSPRELMMRVAAVVKRASGVSRERDIYDFKGLHVDFTARSVTVDGARCDLSLKESELLFYLIKNRGRALTRDMLLREVWGYDFYGDDRTLDTHIKLLRKKLCEYSCCIVTLRGVGYRYEEA
ncbi:MAG: response regulator transcription factor [Oscillospiraceae bacterium]